MLSKNSPVFIANPTFLNHPIVARAAPFAIYILFLALTTPLTAWFSNLGLDARWLYAVRISVVLALLLLFARSYQELTWPNSRLDAASWGLSIGIGIAVFLLWIMPWPQWAVMQSDSQGFNALRSDGSIDFVLASIRLSGAALVVPVMEELFWRSFLLRWLKHRDFLDVDPATVNWGVFMVVAIMFGLEHSLWLAGMLAGIAYGALYMARRSLWAPIVAHAVTNGLLGLWVLHSGNWQYW